MFVRQTARSCVMTPRLSHVTYTSQRSIVHISKSSSSSNRSNIPLRSNVGLRKDPKEYLTVNGVLYPGNQETLAPAKKLLGEEFSLSDDLILQAITHKSFAHGLKPYNENLAIIGKHFLRMETTSHAINQKSENPTAVNGINFDVCLSKISNLLSATASTSQISRESGIAKTIFWKSPRAETSSSTVDATAINALIGSVLLKLGQQKAKDFVRSRLLSGKYSLVDVASKIYK